MLMSILILALRKVLITLFSKLDCRNDLPLLLGKRTLFGFANIGSISCTYMAVYEYRLGLKVSLTGPKVLVVLWLVTSTT